MMFYWTLLVALSACDVFPLSISHCVCDCSKCFFGNETVNGAVSTSTNHQNITGEPRMDDRAPMSTGVNHPHFALRTETHNQPSQMYNTLLVSSPDHVALRSMGTKSEPVPTKTTPKPKKENPPKVRRLAKRGKTKKQRMMEEEAKTTQSPRSTGNQSTSLDQKIPRNITETKKPSPPIYTTPKTKLRKEEAEQEFKNLVDLVSNAISQSILEEQEALAREGVTNERLSRARLQMATFKAVKRLGKPLEDLGRLTGDAETAVKVIERAVANNPMFRQVNSNSKALSSRSGRTSITSLSPITKDYIAMIMS
uniref:Uncharacterized protein n=1 Tax=Cuerna arida TaxID=1464854 RepID=A0A1B6EW54_9HEMI